jgi:outer membrane cobalamin receptor
VPVNNSTDSRGGGFDFGTLDSSEFAVAEIVRGPVSARYGPDALSGVIKLASNVVAAPNGSEVAVQAGGRGYAAARVLTGAQQDGIAVAASANWSEDGSREAGSVARHESMAAGTTWKGQGLEGRITVRYGWQESAAFPDDSGGERYAVLRSLEDRSGSTTTAAVELQSSAANDSGIKWRVRSWGAWLHAQDDSPGVAPGLRDPTGLPESLETTTLRRVGVSTEGAVDLSETAVLAAGVDAESEQGTSDAALLYGPLAIPADFSATRDRVGVFAEYTWQPTKGWLLQPSARVDHASGYSPRVTPRLGWRAPLGRDTTLRINAGTGFKRPSFYAVSNPLVGNPALRPERSQTIDAGIERRLAAGRWTIGIDGFSSRYRDGIDFDPGPPPRLVNRNLIRSDGAELSLGIQAAETLEFGLSGTYADVRSEPGGGPLRGRARTEGGLRVRWRPTRTFTIEASARSVGRVLDSSVPTGDRFLPGWWRMDLAARYQLRRGLTLTVAGDNLLNLSYEEAIGVPSPGIRLRAGIEARF